MIEARTPGPNNWWCARHRLPAGDWAKFAPWGIHSPPRVGQQILPNGQQEFTETALVVEGCYRSVD
ncbi:hypothetical protein [Sodalis-like endosymbiont of Proechinophthirus fluctus]|uniref:hypothetical protein n=1 Tax=Sodalis-like endosymbiont of Proechinophthirus fluctus TaxID=1462730 RepID=UPI0016507DFE|nr:hypothetical protein [Sodalis-like endosymbiont of Proechinophthirus fluctus]